MRAVARPSPWAVLHRGEDGLSAIILVVMAVLPLVEMVTRALRTPGIPGTPLILQHLTLCIAFTGAALAAREDRLLALSTGTFLPERARTVVRAIVNTTGGAVATLLALAAVDLVRAEREGGEYVALGVPVWVIVIVMPVFLGAIAARLWWRAGASMVVRSVAMIVSIGVVAGWLAAGEEGWEFLREPHVRWVGLAWMLVNTALGLPMFAALAGTALLLFYGDTTPLAAVPVEAYRLTASPLFPAIPLFTLGGYILAAGGASTRLVRVFQACFGWLPGGPAVVTTLVFAFFTSVTGASGVTILSLGGLLMPVLLRTHFPERFSLGLLTTSGSIGLLFPPSLPVILYAVSAQVPIDELFVGALVPGVLLVVAVAILGVGEGLRQHVERPRFDAREAWVSLKGAAWELLVPVLIIGGMFGGVATLVESASILVGYTLLVELVVHRDPEFRRNLPHALVECATLVGGVLVILGMAMGFTNYLLDAQIPMEALAWARRWVDTREGFLLLVNVVLILVGAMMDIYSGILVVVPLLVPMAQAFDIHPVHLGVIFLTNLELGYLVPPMGENLFLASYRFHKPLTEVFRATIPFVAIIFVVVMLVTYVPALTLGPVGWYSAP